MKDYWVKLNAEQYARAFVFSLLLLFMLLLITGGQLQFKQYSLFFVLSIFGSSFLCSLCGDKNKTYLRSLIRFSESCQEESDADQLIKELTNEIQSVFSGEQISLIHYDKKTLEFKEEHIQIPNKNITNLKIGEISETVSGSILFIGEKYDTFVYILLSDRGYPIKIRENEADWLRMLAFCTASALQNKLLIRQKIDEIIISDQYKCKSAVLSKVLFSISEIERTKLAQDIHDSIIQELIFICRELEYHVGEYKDIYYIREILLDNIQYIREKCFDLRPPFLMEMGLLSSIQVLIDKYKSNHQLDIEFLLDVKDDSIFTEDITINIYRIVQELLINAVKHSKANYIVLTMIQKETSLMFVYEDNGIGINWNTVNTKTNSFGLTGIKERINCMNGIHNIASVENEGLLVRFEISTKNE
ncbi:sensor histidine kinase [Bacillus sp. ISL-51]|uniref:sensor histidine kinase n=1 Tax=Bacteria TaxID=2 RepID=UPI001BE8DBC2|nr:MULTISPECIES: ATP-binding protein [Bacteria]MBT2573733.1 sensor histidine kinase [Bacillus sp. ISL-51]MBT2634936.1 sensor histidine kinase [Bacillus sp. ISL-26]MBT2712410.1 hypothetical protein [Pseudomonas sp. ISL-88]